MVWFVVFVVLGTGELDFSYDYAGFREGDRTILKLYYELPYNELQFVRESGGFLARYRVYLQCFAKMELVAGEVWQREVRASTFEETKGRGRWSDEVAISLDPGEYRVELKLEDLTSRHTGRVSFDLDLSPSRVSGIKFLSAGRPHPTRRYETGDTLGIEFEVYNSDSIRIEVVDEDGGVRFAQVEVVSGDEAELECSIPLADWPEGSYRVRLLSRGRVERVESFRVTSPFWLSDASYLLKVDQLRYIATPEELERLKRARLSERDSLWQEFWRAKDPTPNTEVNEVADEYFRRIAYCEERFGPPDYGYRSDRAKVYMRLGPPDEVESHPFEFDRWAYEVWYYYAWGHRFVFVDRYGLGVYTLVSPPHFR